MTLRRKVRRALAAVYDGADALEADALLDAFDDLNLRVTEAGREQEKTRG